MRSLTLDPPALMGNATTRHRPAPQTAPAQGARPQTSQPAVVRTRSSPAEAQSVPAQADPARDELRDVVLRARDGESDAFGVLYDRYVDLIYRFVYYRVGTHALAEDLTSETFLRALRRMSLFTWQGKDFGAWLVTIARNIVLDHFKSSRYRLEICTAEMLETDRWEEGPEGAVLDSFTHRALFSAVRQLGSEQRECVVLRFLHGLSVAETAEVMGKNTGAIKALQYRATRSLARIFPAEIR
ncbi:sigma-70 family RNA polymerase sigma factor [Actinoallomurus bryophytorum]|uniref:RNA polymerase sigma-70 factor (ECF subfamily) n=1 Tax=Actinoallomurus bryophytorum TaxID=1490222 RepID=A0A543CIH9_9ACTN|nr:sigma-70 family RNA polymerase sigma factor [Actinoallomurus bryophytorum]TQL96840.1 RNA polymerase sigma-70 factor (ECF subfamily) [Actinoallomurus bryophytorum]